MTLVSVPWDIGAKFAQNLVNIYILYKICLIIKYMHPFLVYIECDTNPCENNGTCRLLAGSYICNCSQGFSGLFCEQSKAPCLIKLVFYCSLCSDVTFRFEKAEYFVSEDSGRAELCILQSGESIIDLTVPAEPQELTAEGINFI